MRSLSLFLALSASLVATRGTCGQPEPAPVTCAELGKIDWSDKADWKRKIKAQPGRKIADDDTPKLLARIEAMLQPARLSRELKADLAEAGPDFFFYFHPPGSDIYYFGNTQGSGNCNYDTWAERRGDTLTEIENPPFGGQSLCDAPVYFGTVKGSTNVIVQFQYRRPTPLDDVPPVKVDVAVADASRWSKYCSFDLVRK